MNKVFNVDTDEVIKLTNKLEKLNRSAFPNAVRGTLNGMAFDVKTNTMPKEAKDAFIERDKRFFKSQSAVDMAKGFNVSSMQSEVGFRSKSDKSQAVENLEQQEFGGKIGGRSFIAMNPARTSKSNNKLVSKKNRLSSIRNIVNTKNVTGKSEADRFNKSVIFAGIGGLVLSEYKGKEILWRVNSIKKTKNGHFKLTPIYSYKQGRNVTIKKATHFMQKASEKSAAKGNEIYQKEAERQFNRAMR